MRTHFARIFWGLLIVILDVSFNGFDVLVDGIGYVVVAAGCGGLSPLAPRFATARTLCFALAILWFIGLAVTGTFAAVYGLAITVVNCAMVWQLLGGIIEFTLERKRSDLAQRAANRRFFYVVIMSGTSLLAMASSGSRDAAPLAAILVVSMFALLVMILHLIHSVKVQLAD